GGVWWCCKPDVTERTRERCGQERRGCAPTDAHHAEPLPLHRIIPKGSSWGGVNRHRPPQSPWEQTIRLLSARDRDNDWDNFSGNFHHFHNIIPPTLVMELYSRG